MNIPNILTVFRILLIPVFIILFNKGMYYHAIGVYLIAGITDVLDGYIARKCHIVTDFGKLADPLADKLMQITALVVLTVHGFIHIVVVAVVALKEIFMIIGAAYLLKRKDVVVNADWFGKLATAIFFVAVMGCILCKIEPVRDWIPRTWSNAFMIVAVCSTLFAFCGYVIQFRAIIAKQNDRR